MKPVCDYDWNPAGAQTGKLMALIEVSIDPVVVEALFVGAIGTIAIIVGVVAAIRAARSETGAPPRAEQETLPILAERLSMTVTAQGRMSEPLIFCFTLADPAVTLLRIEIANQLDKGAGTARCVEAAPRTFLAEADAELIQRWYNANPYWDGETKRLPIQVFFLSGGEAACRTIWVSMCPRAIRKSGRSDPNNSAWYLEGPCSMTIPRLTRISTRTGTDRQ